MITTHRGHILFLTTGFAFAMLVATPYAQADLLKFRKDKKVEAPAAETVEKESAKDAGQKAEAKPTPEKQKKTYARDYIGSIQTYSTKYEDTMIQMARTYDVGFVELRAANPFLDPWMPGAGKKILIPSMHILPRADRQGVVINLAEMRMYLFDKKGNAPQTFPLGIGREGLSTPSGTTTIVRKKEGPTWRPTARMRKEHPELPVEVPPGADNPMGSHAIYLGWPEYAIHGTDKPYSIGRRASSGCLRMYPEDITRVFSMLPVGTSVTVVNQPVKLGWVGKKLYLEAHPTTDQADKMEIDGGLPGYVFTEEDMGLIVAAAGEYARDLNWPLIRQVIRERRGYPVEIYRQGTQSTPPKTEPLASVDPAPESQPIQAPVKVVINDDAPVPNAAVTAPKKQVNTPN